MLKTINYINTTTNYQLPIFEDAQETVLDMSDKHCLIKSER